MLKILFIKIDPIIVFSSGAEGHVGTDILPRTLNFLIFAGILYYLVAGAAKER